MDSRSLCYSHSIAFAAAPIQNYPYLAYDDDFDAAILSAYLHQQNYTDHPVAVVVELVAFANSFKNDTFFWRIQNLCKIQTEKKNMKINKVESIKKKKKNLHPMNWVFQGRTKCWNFSWMELLVSLIDMA